MTKKGKTVSGRKAGNTRLIVQIFFFALIALIAVNHTLEEAGKAIPILSSASLHASTIIII
jgi:hypothetical protein